MGTGEERKGWFKVVVSVLLHLRRETTALTRRCSRLLIATKTAMTEDKDDVLPSLEQ